MYGIMTRQTEFKDYTGQGLKLPTLHQSSALNPETGNHLTDSSAALRDVTSTCVLTMSHLVRRKVSFMFRFQRFRGQGLGFEVRTGFRSGYVIPWRSPEAQPHRLHASTFCLDDKCPSTVRLCKPVLQRTILKR